MFSKNEKQLHQKLCVDLAQVCPKDAVPDTDDSISESSETYDFEREELWWINFFVLRKREIPKKVNYNYNTTTRSNNYINIKTDGRTAQLHVALVI